MVHKIHDISKDMRRIITDYLITITLGIIFISFVPLRCETDVNECATPDQCQNNGSCQNFNGTYNCTCPDLFGGVNCQVPVSSFYYCSQLTVSRAL